MKPSLRSLKIIFPPEAAETMSSPGHLLVALARLTGLRELVLSVPPSTEQVLDLSHLVDEVENGGDISADDLPPLGALTLASFVLHDSAVSFATLFASTLTTLHLDTFTLGSGFDTDLVDYDEPAFQNETFPLVEEVVLRGQSAYTSGTLESMVGAVFPSLRRLRYDADMAVWQRDAFPFPLLDTHRQLAALTLPEIYDVSVLVLFRDYCAERNIELATSPTTPYLDFPIRLEHFQHIQRGPPAPGTDEHRHDMSHHSAAVSDLAQFLLRRVEDCTRTNDLGGLARLSAVLKGVGVEKAAMEM